jgi:hypothetical protein
MWYLADVAAVSGYETSCFIADISLYKRSVIDAHVLTVAVGESKTEAGRGRTASPNVLGAAHSPASRALRPSDAAPGLEPDWLSLLCQYGQL